MEESYFKKEVALRQDGLALSFHVSQQLFSSHEVDAGSKLLLRTLTPQRAGEARTVLDLGCGYGTLGLALKALDPQRTVHLVDRDALAVAFARRNAALNGLDDVRVYGSLGYDDVQRRDFDLIVSNIPGKAGERVITHLLLAAQHYLQPNGRVAVVVVAPLAQMVGKLLAETTTLLLTESTPNYTVFHYRFSGPPPETAVSPHVYRRDHMQVTYKKLAFEMETAYGLPEFDTVSYQNRLLFNLLADLSAPAAHVLVRNPGQGHGAVAAWKLAQPAQITLVDRDLLALRTAQHNLTANGCPPESVVLYHQIDVPAPETAVDLTLAVLPDSEGPRLNAAWVRQAARQMAANGRMLLAANSHLVSQLLPQLAPNAPLKLLTRKKRKGYSAVLFVRY